MGLVWVGIHLAWESAIWQVIAEYISQKRASSRVGTYRVLGTCICEVSLCQLPYSGAYSVDEPFHITLRYILLCKSVNNISILAQKYAS